MTWASMPLARQRSTIAADRSAATTPKPSCWKYELSCPVPAPISSSRAPGASRSRNACRSASFHCSLSTPSRQLAPPSYAARNGPSTSSYRIVIPIIIGKSSTGAGQCR